MSEKKESNINDYLIKIGKEFKFKLTMFIFLWIILGLTAFVSSLMCIGKSGKFNDKMIGIVLALLLGPFYFIYLMINNNYCR